MIRLTFVFLVIALLFVMACGMPTLPPPEAEEIYLDVPRDADVWFDGMYLGEGPRILQILANYPNYVRVDDWRLVLFSSLGMDSLRLRGESTAGAELEFVVPERIEIGRE